MCLLPSDVFRPEYEDKICNLHFSLSAVSIKQFIYVQFNYVRYMYSRYVQLTQLAFFDDGEWLSFQLVEISCRCETNIEIKVYWEIYITALSGCKHQIIALPRSLGPTVFDMSLMDTTAETWKPDCPEQARYGPKAPDFIMYHLLLFSIKWCCHLNKYRIVQVYSLLEVTGNPQYNIAC